MQKISIQYLIHAFYSLVNKRQKKMVVFKEISDYFTKLVESLVTTQKHEEMFGKIKEEIIERFEEKFTAQN